MFGQNQRVSPIGKILFYGSLSIASFLVIYPFLFMLFTSLKDSPEVFQNILAPLGKALRFDNYATVLADDTLDGAFLAAARERHLLQLKGHRAVGGMRASIYNAMPLEGVRTLAAFMRDFERAHG